MFSLFCLGIVLLQQGIADSSVSQKKFSVLKERQEGAEGGATWSYIGPEDGVHQWSKNYETCGGKSQSPINLHKFATMRPKLLRNFKFHGYDTLRSGMSLINNGHSAELHLNLSDEQPYIEFGGLGANYTFAQLHFHWGRDNSEGSEHIVKGLSRTTLEAHFVHVNPDEAKDGRAGIAVLGILFKTRSSNNADYAPIVNNLKNITYKGQEVVVPESFNLNSLLPRLNKSKFYRYNGSLTTPPCTEGVIWTVFDQVETIGEAQMNQFRTLMRTPENSAEPENMAPNFRPVQPLNNRPIYKVLGVPF